MPSDDLHPLLRRQLARQGINPRLLTAGLVRLIDEVDAAYRGFDSDRLMLERSLELTSQEMSETNFELRRAVEDLRQAEARLEERVQQRTEELATANTELSREVAERVRSEQEMAYLALHDWMTGLPNRRAFFEAAEQMLVHYREEHTPTSLIYLDLDQFKDVNDTRGHLTGDQLLIQFAETLQHLVAPEHFLARFGGDEFGILLPGVSLEEAVRIADSMMASIRRTTYQIDGQTHAITASMGVSTFTRFDFDSQDILSRSDQALYEAKAKGRNRYAVVRGTKKWREQAEQRLLWHSRILEGLKQSRFTLFMQPIYDLNSGQPACYEALLRLQGSRGFIRPDEFLGIAERTGLSLQIDHWVVSEAIRLVGEFKRHGIQIKLSINLSAEALDSGDIGPLIKSELEQHAVEPRQLIFEVTESVTAADLPRARKLIMSIKNLGCAFALDDFGAGFSSLRELKYLPVDYLKIDGDFIENMATSQVDQNLVKTIAMMARDLGKVAIAEYISDRESVSLLRSFGIELGQGYFLGRPTESSHVLNDLLNGHLALAG